VTAASQPALVPQMIASEWVDHSGGVRQGAASTQTEDQYWALHADAVCGRIANKTHAAHGPKVGPRKSEAEGEIAGVERRSARVDYIVAG
jgi:hypothetical protein